MLKFLSYTRAPSNWPLQLNCKLSSQHPSPGCTLSRACTKCTCEQKQAPWRTLRQCVVKLDAHPDPSKFWMCPSQYSKPFLGCAMLHDLS